MDVILKQYQIKVFWLTQSNWQSYREKRVTKTMLVPLRLSLLFPAMLPGAEHKGLNRTSAKVSPDLWHL